VGFWQQQVDDLLTSVDELGGRRVQPDGTRTPLQPLQEWVEPAGASIDSGSGAAAAADATVAIEGTHAALVEADRVLTTTLNDAHAADAASRAQLNHIHQEVRAVLEDLEPSLQTPAGRQQLADFLEMKAVEAKQVTDNAQQTAARVAALLLSATQKFGAAEAPS